MRRSNEFECNIFRNIHMLISIFNAQYIKNVSKHVQKTFLQETISRTTFINTDMTLSYPFYSMYFIQF